MFLLFLCWRQNLIFNALLLILHSRGTSAADCTDMYKACSDYASKGYCTSEFYTVYMKTTCPRACGLCGCLSPRALGMENGNIKDTQITASSYRMVSGWSAAPHCARLNNQDEYAKPGSGLMNYIGGWCTDEITKQYLQVDLGKIRIISGIATQGRDRSYEWVKSYNITFSLDAKEWHMQTEGGQPKVFNGNTDANTVVTNQMKEPITARYLRVIPLTVSFVCMRMEIYGCDEGEISPTGTTTVQPSQTTTVDPKCVDTGNECKAWAAAGYCKTLEQMKVYCKKTCCFCGQSQTTCPTTPTPPISPTVTPGVCEDTHEKCASWAQRYECLLNPDWMSINCALSCKKCGFYPTRQPPQPRTFDCGKKFLQTGSIVGGQAALLGNGRGKFHCI